MQKFKLHCIVYRRRFWRFYRRLLSWLLGRLLCRLFSRLFSGLFGWSRRLFGWSRGLFVWLWFSTTLREDAAEGDEDEEDEDESHGGGGSDWPGWEAPPSSWQEWPDGRLPPSSIHSGAAVHHSIQEVAGAGGRHLAQYTPSTFQFPVIAGNSCDSFVLSC